MGKRQEKPSKPQCMEEHKFPHCKSLGPPFATCTGISALRCDSKQAQIRCFLERRSGEAEFRAGEADAVGPIQRPARFSPAT